MATPISSSSQSQSSGSSGRKTDWNALVPKFVGYEDSMSPTETSAVWDKIYKLVGAGSADETTRASIRMGIYVYSAKNGTSREGNYSGQIQVSTGTKFDAGVIPRAAGKMNIRKFHRGNMEESYNALKETDVIGNDDRMAARAASLGISAAHAFAMADWMTDCPFFTPAEKAAHDKSFQHSLSRARRARGGRSLEDVEGKRLDDGLIVQGELNSQDERQFTF